MPPVIQTFGLPAQTHVVHASSPAIPAHRIVALAAEERQVALPGSAPALAAFAGVSQTRRDPGQPLAVNEMGEALIECSAAVNIGDELILEAGATGRAAPRGAAVAGTRRIAIARSRTALAGQLVVADLSVKNTGAL